MKKVNDSPTTTDETTQQVKKPIDDITCSLPASRDQKVTALVHVSDTHAEVTTSIAIKEHKTRSSRSHKETKSKDKRDLDYSDTEPKRPVLKPTQSQKRTSRVDLTHKAEDNAGRRPTVQEEPEEKQLAVRGLPSRGVRRKPIETVTSCHEPPEGVVSTRASRARDRTPAQNEPTPRAPPETPVPLNEEIGRTQGQRSVSDRTLLQRKNIEKYAKENSPLLTEISKGVPVRADHTTSPVQPRNTSKAPSIESSSMPYNASSERHQAHRDLDEDLYTMRAVSLNSAISTDLQSSKTGAIRKTPKTQVPSRRDLQRQRSHSENRNLERYPLTRVTEHGGTRVRRNLEDSEVRRKQIGEYLKFTRDAPKPGDLFFNFLLRVTTIVGSKIKKYKLKKQKVSWTKILKYLKTTNEKLEKVKNLENNKFLAYYYPAYYDYLPPTVKIDPFHEFPNLLYINDAFFGNACLTENNNSVGSFPYRLKPTMSQPYFHLPGVTTEAQTLFTKYREVESPELGNDNARNKQSQSREHRESELVQLNKQFVACKLGSIEPSPDFDDLSHRSFRQPPQVNK